MSEERFEEIQEIAIDKIEDLVSDFIYYDRKEDEELSLDDVKHITVETVEKMTKKFREELLDQL